MKKLLLLPLIIIFISCTQRQAYYSVQIKLSDGSWKDLGIITADSINNFEISNSCYGCGSTVLFGNVKGHREKLSAFVAIDFKYELLSYKIKQ